jgi:HSP20 family protein
MSDRECMEMTTVSPRSMQTSRTQLRPERAYREGYGQGYWPMASRQYAPALEVSENGDEIRVTVELPGVDPQDVSTTMTSGTLVIQGEKKFASDVGDHEVCSCSERSYGHFRRTVRMPDSVEVDQISARFEHGVLRVVLPKKEGARARTIQVQSS